MQKRSLMNYNIANRTTTTWVPRALPVVILQWLAMFIPYLFALSISWISSNKEAEEFISNEQFWIDWHAKYDRYRTEDGTHRLDWIQAGDGYGQCECRCGLKIVGGSSEEDVLLVFQTHLDEHAPIIYDLSKAPGKYLLANLKKETINGKS